MRSDQPEPLTLSQYILYTVKTQHPRSVEQLVKIVQQNYHVQPDKIMEHILHLQSQGKLLFEKKLFPATLLDFIRSKEALWYWIVITLTLVTAISVFFVSENSFPLIYGRYILGFLFVLVLPGYSLIKALFPTRELDNVERTALSIGLSLALVSIIGLALNYTPWGIRVTPITLGLLMLNTIFATTAIIREYDQLIKRQ